MTKKSRSRRRTGPKPSDDGRWPRNEDVPDTGYATYFTGFFSGVLFCIVVGLVLLGMMGILP